MRFDTNYVAEDDRSRIEAQCRTDHLAREPLSVRVFDGACIVPKNGKFRGGIYVGGKCVGDSTWYEDFGNSPNPDFDPSGARFEDTEVVHLGMFIPVWGHCITDNLRHLWFLLDPEYAFLKDKPFVHVVWNQDPLPANFLRILERLGIDPARLRRIDEPTRFRRIYLPGMCFVNNRERHCREYTREFVRLIDRISEGIPPATGTERLYFTRSGLQKFRDYGEPLVENVFRRIGCSVVRPDRLSLEEQIAMLKGCRFLAGTDGSVLHNSVFLPEGASLAVVRKADYVNVYQAALNQMRNLDVTYIDAHKSVMNPKVRHFDGPFFMYVTPELARFAGIPRPPFPLRLFAKYIAVSALRTLARPLRARFRALSAKWCPPARLRAKEFS